MTSQSATTTTNETSVAVPSTNKNTKSPQSPPENNSIEWFQILELSYDTRSSPCIISNTVSRTLDTPTENCFQCGKSASESESSKLATCSKCKVAKYCSRDCQIQNWKTGRIDDDSESHSSSSLILHLTIPHKHLCRAFQSCGPTLQLNTEAKKKFARNSLWTSIRFYSCPYSVHHSQTLGRGFCFVQSPFTLDQIVLPRQVFSKLYSTQRSTNVHTQQDTDSQLNRNVLIHFLTLGEFDSEVCKDDFELASVRNTLTKLVNEYDRKKELVVMMRFRCGHVAAGIVRTLVPEFRICKSLGRDYYGNTGTSEGGVQALQLNLDDL